MSGSTAGADEAVRPTLFQNKIPFGGEPEPADEKLLLQCIYENAAPTYSYVNTKAAALFNQVEVCRAAIPIFYFCNRELTCIPRTSMDSELRLSYFG